MVGDVDTFRSSNQLDGVGSIPSRLADVYTFKDGVTIRKVEVLNRLIQVRVVIYKDHYDISQIFLERDAYVPEFDFKGIISRIKELPGDRFEIYVTELAFHLTRRLYPINQDTDVTITLANTESFPDYLQGIIDSANLDNPFTWVLDDGIPATAELNFKAKHKNHYEILRISALNSGNDLWFDGPRVAVGVKGKNIKIDRKDVIFKTMETDQDLDVFANIIKLFGGKDSSGTKLSKTESTTTDLKYNYEKAVVDTEIVTTGVLNDLAPKMLANSSNLDPDVVMNVTRAIYDKYNIESGDVIEIMSKDSNQQTKGFYKVIEIEAFVDHRNPDKIELKLKHNKENVFAPHFKTVTDAISILFDQIGDLELDNLNNISSDGGNFLGNPVDVVNGQGPGGDFGDTYIEQEDGWFKRRFYDNLDLPIPKDCPEEKHIIDLIDDVAALSNANQVWKIPATSGEDEIGFYFQDNSGNRYKTIKKFKIRMRKVGNPGGNASIIIRTSTGVVKAQGSFPVSIIGSSYSTIEVALDTPYNSGGSSAENYMVQYTGGDGSNYIEIDAALLGRTGTRWNGSVFSYEGNETLAFDIGDDFDIDAGSMMVSHTVTAADIANVALDGFAAGDNDFKCIVGWQAENVDSISHYLEFNIYIDKQDGNGPIRFGSNWSNQRYTVPNYYFHGYSGDSYTGYLATETSGVDESRNHNLKVGDIIYLSVNSRGAHSTAQPLLRKAYFLFYPRIGTSNQNTIIADIGETGMDNNNLSPGLFGELGSTISRYNSNPEYGYVEGGGDDYGQEWASRFSGDLYILPYGVRVYWERAGVNVSDIQDRIYMPKIRGLALYRYLKVT